MLIRDLMRTVRVKLEQAFIDAGREFLNPFVILENFFWPQPNVRELACRAGLTAGTGNR